MAGELDQDVIDEITGHMNHDHSGAVLILAQKMASYPSAVSAEMAGFNKNGIMLSIKFEKGCTQDLLEFESPIENSSEIKQAIIDLLRRAREID